MCSMFYVSLGQTEQYFPKMNYFKSNRWKHDFVMFWVSLVNLTGWVRQSFDSFCPAFCITYLLHILQGGRSATTLQQLPWSFEALENNHIP